jgi:predicted DNA-binding transcriptional regulator AlpA
MTTELTIHCDLTAADIGKMIGVNGTTIKRWSARGLFPRPFLTVGSTQRWAREVVEQWIAEHRKDGAA